MRHNKKGRKLNRTSAHRIALLKNLACDLILHHTIRTTLPKAKELRPFVEPLVTKAKRGGLANLRNVLSALHNRKGVAKHLFDVVAPAMKDRNGGYTRIVKAGYRHGDNAPMAVIQFVDIDVANGSFVKVKLDSKLDGK